MNVARTIAARLLLAAALVAGIFVAVEYGPSLVAAGPPAAIGPSMDGAAAGTVIYYRDPDGKPLYSADPAKTADGRAYLPVRASEDVSFDETGAVKPTAAAAVAPPATSVGNQPGPVLYYRNPMGLADTSPVPKKDSMGMAYIPVYQGEDDQGPTVKIALGKIQLSGAKTESVGRRVVTSLVRAPGTVQPDERRVSVISMRSETWVERVEDVTTGMSIRQGQPLFRGYSPAIAAAGAEYLVALRAGPEARSTSGSPIRQKLINLATPDSAVAAIEKTREVPLSVTWAAPRDGIVVERNIVDGMRVNAGDVLFRIADYSAVWALIDIAERDIQALSLGQSVFVRARSYPDRPFTGTVSAIYPELNAQTRTARVRVELHNPDLLLKPEMYVDAEVDVGSSAPVLAVPQSAVINSGTRQLVLIDKGEGRFEPREVKLGRKGDGYFEVTEGLSESELVVTAANFLIDAESNLKAALNAFADGQKR
jgi:membrane fusion protein, copper/silver efflux system